MIMQSDSASSGAGRSQAALGVEMRESVLRTIDQAEKVRPKNTSKNYDPMQKEFTDWCEEKGFDSMTVHQVTSEKLHLFLEEKVISRPLKRQKKKPSGEPGDKKTLAQSTVKLYAAAVIDLYTKQVSRGVNSAPHPRAGPVRTLLNTRRLQERERRKREYVDRGIGTALDAYTSDQFGAVSRFFLQRNSEVGLRDRLAFLISHFALLRGDNARNLELADLHHLELKEEGPSQCFAIVLLLANGKTNQAGRVEYGSFLRNKDVFVCPVGALALYLFSSAEPFPDLSASSKWYDMKVIKAPKSAVEPISEETHTKALDAAFTACKVMTTAKTHAARKSGAQLAETAGASEAAVRRAGRWNQTTMETCYLTRLPRPVLRVHAGFHRDGGSYFIRRAKPPPQALQQQVFPQADAWEDAIAKGKDTAGRPVEINIAARAFVRLLIFLRSVLIQDAVMLKQQYPNFFLWSHPLFSSHEFIEYEAELSDSLAQPDTSSGDQLRAALPLVAEQIEAHSNATQQHVDQLIDHLRHDVDSRLDTVVDLLHDVRQQHQQQAGETHSLLRGLVGFVLAAHGSSASGAPLDTSILSGAVLSTSSTRTIIPSASGLGPSASSSVLAAAGQRSSVPSSASSSQPHHQKMPSVTQERSLGSCAELWKEYKEGLKGLPSVEEMDAKWGAAWRCEDKDRKHYERRMRIILRIQALAVEHKVSEAVAVTMLDHARNQLQNKSLAKLSEHIREGKQLSFPDLSLRDV